MSLRDLQLSYEYRSDSTNIVDDFYIPCLRESKEYLRAVGFFTSNGLALGAKGLAAFINREGHMRLVASPWLEPEDIEAFTKGYEAKENILERALLRQFGEELLTEASLLTRHRLECLAWLIADERLEIKLAIPSPSLLSNGHGIYHEKIGVFIDVDGNSVAFTGSPNETVGGLVSNFESIDVFKSWEDTHGRVERKRSNFERLWNDLTSGLTVVEFPVAVKRRLLRFRTATRPETDLESETSKSSNVPVSTPTKVVDVPSHIKLRNYQVKAVEAWRANDGKGILAMATGSGKTITALASAVGLFKEIGKIFVVVTCPFQHLVDQWAREAELFGFRPILAYQTRHSWLNTLNACIVDYNLGNRDNVLVIASHATFIGEPMQNTLSKVKRPSLIIADEVHHLGAEKGRISLPQMFVYRMGLSATPKRWFDEEGTTALEEYFGQTVYEFPLKDAIREGCLSKYYYYPHLVELTIDELQEYEDLTIKIVRMFESGAVPGEVPALDFLLRKRSYILNTASEKLNAVGELVRRGPELHHALFYCVHGQIDEVTHLLGNVLGIRVHHFTMEESVEERKRLLESFAKVELQALIAIRCLDEGVDVPSTQTAYMLASSSNPREFIQRRGRILRKSPEKEFAVIHDMIAIPSRSYFCNSETRPTFNTERRILKKELTRFREFAECSENRFQATEIIWDLAKMYNLLDF